ncbi:hypothetical protein [Fusobacterium sp. PH5-44]|uniref:hypothetical protein n=1 Tax=unclassified Fusobacterium TaxID=2648384 RepID=UPI003D1C02B6
MINKIFSKKKYFLFLLLINLFNVSQGETIIKRKDSVQYVNFNKNYPTSEVNVINIYQINYPASSKEKDKFFAEMNVLASKLLLHKSSINIIFPDDLLADIHSINEEGTFTNESLYSKYAADLTDNDKHIIDRAIDVGYPEDFGDIQEHLNKQVYYWLNYLGRADEYDPEMYYSEFDKSELMEEVIENRKNLVKTIYPIQDNAIIEINEKNLNQAYSLENPIYISDKLLKKLDMTKIKSRIIFKPFGNLEKIYKNKLTLVEGKTSTTIKDYSFYPIIFKKKNISELINNIDNNTVKINELKNFSFIERKGKKINRATVRKNIPQRNTIQFRDGVSEWVID